MPFPSEATVFNPAVPLHALLASINSVAGSGDIRRVAAPQPGFETGTVLVVRPWAGSSEYRFTVLRFPHGTYVRFRGRTRKLQF